MELSYFGENIIGSEILKISGKINKKILNGDKIFNYTIGDFNPNIYPIPDGLRSLIETAYIENDTNYPASTGELSLKKSISEHLNRKHNIFYTEDEILVGAGVRPLIYTLFKTLVNPTDNIIFPVPSWNNNHYTFLHNGTPVPIECTEDNDFFPKVEDIEKNIETARLVCLCSPQNPTGKVIKPELLKSICDVIVKENERRKKIRDYFSELRYDDTFKIAHVLNDNLYRPVYLFFDQIYSDIARVEQHHPLVLTPQIKDYLICVDGISKSLCATGLRVGWMFGPENFIKKAGEIFSHIGAWAPKPEQIGVANFLKNNFLFDSYVKSRKEVYSYVSEKICNVFEVMKTKQYDVDYKRSDGAIYISIYLGDTLKFDSTDDTMDFLINECNVGLIPFEYFGTNENKGWFRLSIGNVDVAILNEHLEKIKNTIIKLKEKK